MAQLGLVEVEAGQRGKVRAWTRGGKPGNVAALLEMRRIIRQACGLDGAKENKELSDVADFILHAWKVDGHNDYQVLRAVHEFVAANVHYIQDRAGGYERLQYPLETLRRGYGDCDDLTILESTLLGLCGVQAVELEAADYFPDTDGYDHVYLFAGVGPELALDGRFYLDPTAADRPLGWHKTDGILEWARLPVFADENEATISGFGGILDNLIQTGAQIGAAYAQNKAVSSKQAKELGKQFDAAAGQVAALFREILGRKPNGITVEDYNTAAAALSALASIAQQYPIDYITRQWNSQSYKPSLELSLSWIRDFATQGATGTATGGAGGTNTNGGNISPSGNATTPGTGTGNNALIGIAALALVALLLARG